MGKRRYLRPDRRHQRQVEARDRQAEYESLTKEEKKVRDAAWKSKALS